jgi:Tol biopolymer transport system component
LFAGVMNAASTGAIAYVAHDFSTHVRSVRLDPGRGVVTGEPSDVFTGQRAWLDIDVSRDGQSIAMRSSRMQEDIWVMAVDGSGLRNVTNDAARDRGPRWAPDGSLLFYSSRAGNYGFWAVRPDGSGARQLTQGHTAINLNHPIPSPDGRWIAGSDPNSGELFIFDSHDWTKAPEQLPAAPTRSTTYLWDWSPDGAKIASRDTALELRVFTVASRAWEAVGEGVFPRWLPDGRRLVAQRRGRVVIVDTIEKTSGEIYAETDRSVFSIALSPDARRLYFTTTRNEADIWLMRFDPPPPGAPR